MTPSVSVFRHKLKKFLCQKSYPDYFVVNFVASFSVLRYNGVEVFYLGHLKYTFM